MEAPACGSQVCTRAKTGRAVWPPSSSRTDFQRIGLGRPWSKNSFPVSPDFTVAWLVYIARGGPQQGPINFGARENCHWGSPNPKSVRQRLRPERDVTARLGFPESNVWVTSKVEIILPFFPLVHCLVCSEHWPIIWYIPSSERTATSASLGSDDRFDPSNRSFFFFFSEGMRGTSHLFPDLPNSSRSQRRAAQHRRVPAANLPPGEA